MVNNTEQRFFADHNTANMKVIPATTACRELSSNVFLNTRNQETNDSKAMDLKSRHTQNTTCDSDVSNFPDTKNSI